MREEAATPTEDFLGVEDFLVVFSVVDLRRRRRRLLVALVLTGAPPLAFWAPPVRVGPLLHPAGRIVFSYRLEKGKEVRNEVGSSFEVTVLDL